MELIRLSHKNIAKEHIRCALSGAESKKERLDKMFDGGPVFIKGNVRGKCFIEYIPAENAWAPVKADGYMYINCLWVSGRFKGQGYSNLLIDECIRDSREKHKKGLAILSSRKKAGFLSDKKYLLHKGFELCDTAAPYFELMCLPFEEDAQKPRFEDQVRSPYFEGVGFTLFIRTGARTPRNTCLFPRISR